MSSIRLDLDKLKHSSPEDIESAVTRMAILYLSAYERFLEIVQENSSLFLVDTSNPQKLLQSVFLSLILASGGSTPGDKQLRDSTINKVSIISSKIGLTYSDVLNLTTYELKFLSLLDELNLQT